MSRAFASIIVVFWLIASACVPPPAQPVDCRCADASPPVIIEFRAAQDSAAPGYTPMTLKRHGMSETVFVSETVGLTMADVASVSTVRLDAGRPMLALSHSPGGTQKMKALSTAQMGKRLAFLVDGRLVQAGTVVAEIGESAMITGSLTEDECCAITCAFRATRGPDRPAR